MQHWLGGHGDQLGWERPPIAQAARSGLVNTAGGAFTYLTTGGTERGETLAVSSGHRVPGAKLHQTLTSGMQGRGPGVLREGPRAGAAGTLLSSGQQLFTHLFGIIYLWSERWVSGPVQQFRADATGWSELQVGEWKGGCEKNVEQALQASMPAGHWELGRKSQGTGGREPDREGTCAVQ